MSIALLIVWRWTGYLSSSSWPDSRTCHASCTRPPRSTAPDRCKQFRHITLPALKPVTAFVVVTCFIGAAQIFEEPFLLTRGGPNFATLSVSIFIYRAAFQRQQFGYAAAAAVVLFALVFVLSQLVNRLLGIGRVRHDATTTDTRAPAERRPAAAPSATDHVGAPCCRRADRLAASW